MGLGRLWFLGSILKKGRSSWHSLTQMCVWCPVRWALQTSSPAVPWLQCLFSDPITYSSLDFSCLGLIILNPLYLIISQARYKASWGIPSSIAEG